MDSPTLIDELKKAYQILNETLFSNELPDVEFAIQTKRKIPLRWFADSESLIIGAEFPKLGHLEIQNILLHEMIHIANHYRGVVDVTANQYHNKVFLELALEVGLVVIKHKTQGWAVTSTVIPRNVVEKSLVKRPDKDACKLRQDAFSKIDFDKSILREGFNDIRNKIKQEKPVKTYFLKYECNCPPPHNSIRSGRRPDGPNALNIQCMNCRSHFECVTDLDIEI